MIDFTQKEIIDNVLKTLTNNGQVVIKLYSGYENGYRYTLQEISDIVGISRTRVTQLKNRAFEKLRHESRLNMLRGVYKEVSEKDCI